MSPFLDNVAAWFAVFGIHPVLGAFAVGVLAVLVLRPLRPSVPKAEMTIRQGATSSQIVAPDGRAVPIPPQVVDDARNGNKIAAIKALRKAMPIDLVEAKRIVERLAGR